MRKILLGLIAVAAIGFACLAPISQASAGGPHWGHHHGGWGGHGGHGHHGHGFHGWRGHYDYHRPSLRWHGNHWDYIPGHYHYHHGNHFHW